jgi:hypothetical protein
VGCIHFLLFPKPLLPYIPKREQSYRPPTPPSVAPSPPADRPPACHLPPNHLPHQAPTRHPPRSHLTYRLTARMPLGSPAASGPSIGRGPPPPAHHSAMARATRCSPPATQPSASPLPPAWASIGRRSTVRLSSRAEVARLGRSSTASGSSGPCSARGPVVLLLRKICRRMAEVRWKFAGFGRGRDQLPKILLAPTMQQTK